MTPILVGIYIFLIGICIGSFLNVCIFRIPEGKSIVYPPSACPACGNGIRWYDNIPVLSYLLLRGKCRHCRYPISVRYPLVELLTGLFAWVTWMTFGFQWDTVIFFILIAALITITFIDLDHRIIPDIISLPGIPLGFLASFALSNVTWLESLLGIVIGGGILLIIAVGYKLLTGKEGMGGGDIKLLAMIGAFLGWQGVLFTIMISSFTGTIVGLMLMLRSNQGTKLAVPFGPFLAIGAITYLFFGSQLIEWYIYGFLYVPQ